MPTIKITKTAIDELLSPDKGQVFYRDKVLKGFGVYVGKNAKTYFVEKWVHNKAVRTVIGKHGAITAENARKMAQELLGKMSSGVNPNAEKKAHRVDRVTIKTAFADYVTTRKSLKERTLYDYQRAMKIAFSDWQNKPMNEISKDMVSRRHVKLGETMGQAQANQAMRFLRALYNFAIGKYENSKGHPLILFNPVRGLSDTKAWYRVERRQTLIKAHELPAWYEAVSNLESLRPGYKAEVIRDYLLFLLFTGLRREEAARLTWENVDLKDRTITITDTKNREPLTLPLSDFLFDLLCRRRNESSDTPFVFAGEGKTGHIVEPKKQIDRVIKASGVKFSCHDLRRTFITIAESLDIPHYALKRLLNHKSSGDVTAGYIVLNAERLRAPMQKITDQLLKLAGVKEAGKIVPITINR